MLREACHLASKNVDEAMKLENKGLIAQLVCVSLPLRSQWELGCRCWRERVGASCPVPRRQPGMGSELSRTGPSDSGCFSWGAAAAQVLGFK